MWWGNIDEWLWLFVILHAKLLLLSPNSSCLFSLQHGSDTLALFGSFCLLLPTAPRYVHPLVCLGLVSAVPFQVSLHTSLQLRNFACCISVATLHIGSPFVALPSFSFLFSFLFSFSLGFRVCGTCTRVRSVDLFNARSLFALAQDLRPTAEFVVFGGQACVLSLLTTNRLLHT
jgi:hypothetical protein